MNLPISKSVHVLGALLLTCGLAACTGSSGGDATAGAAAPKSVLFVPTPDTDPFYAQPDPLPQVPPGTILNSRAVTFAPLGVPLPNPAWQLQYMSTDMHGKPQAQIATVVKPLLPAASGNKPLLSYHFFTDSPGLKCAPSHQVTGSRENPVSQLEAFEYIPEALAFGWTLIFPDYQGPTASVAVGRLHAPIVLDGIRAAEHFQLLGLPGAETPVGMMGYSGGSIPTAWAAALQPDYAPELNIVGAAAGGFVANLDATAKAFDGGPLMATGFAGLLSVNRVFPQFWPPGLLTPEGVRLAESLKDSCGGMATDGSMAPITGHYTDYMTAKDFFATPGAREVFPQLQLPQPGEVPTTDIYFYQQTLDQLAPIAEAEKVVAAWCAAGSRIHFKRDLSGEHVVGGETFVPGAYAYLLSRFGSSPTPVLPLGTESCN